MGEHLSGVSCGFCGVAWPLAMLWQRSSVRTARARASMPLSQARPSTRALPLHPPSTLSDAADATQLYACMRHADSFPCATPTALHRPAEELAGVHDAVAQRPTTVSRPPTTWGMAAHDVPVCGPTSRQLSDGGSNPHSITQRTHAIALFTSNMSDSSLRIVRRDVSMSTHSVRPGCVSKARTHTSMQRVRGEAGPSSAVGARK